jgi:hypothetical protein
VTRLDDYYVSDAVVSTAAAYRTDPGNSEKVDHQVLDRIKHSHMVVSAALVHCKCQIGQCHWDTDCMVVGEFLRTRQA